MSDKNNNALAALKNIDGLLGQLSLPRDGHVQVQKDVDCIRRALSVPARRNTPEVESE